MYKTLVVGVDGSPREAAVLEQAIFVAQSHDAKLHLVRAMSVPISIPAAAWTLKGDDLGSFLVDHGKKELGESARKVPSALLGSISSRLGQPSEVLCDMARELSADLIVIGSHGYDRLDRLLGTTAAKVVNRAPCSVLVVRPPA